MKHIICYNIIYAMISSVIVTPSPCFFSLSVMSSISSCVSTEPLVCWELGSSLCRRWVRIQRGQTKDLSQDLSGPNLRWDTWGSIMLLLSSIVLLQILYTGIVIYTPALALTQGTLWSNISNWSHIKLLGFVHFCGCCITYSSFS